jgi:hypothetical protein
LETCRFAGRFQSWPTGVDEQTERELLTMLSNEQYKEIKDALDDFIEDEKEMTLAGVKLAIKQLLDREPYRQAVIKLLDEAENLGLEVSTDDETGELYISTGVELTSGDQTYSNVVFLSEDDDSE